MDRGLWRAKNADTFKPMGPWIETDVDLDAMETTVRLNGKDDNHFKTNDMVFGIQQFIAEMTKYFTLLPGDVIWMGTDGSSPDLKAGDVVEVDITGILGGIPSDVEHLVHMKETAEKLFGRHGDTLQLFIHGTGTRNIRAATTGGLLGTHIRVGQEDNLFDKPGVPFKSNAEQIERMTQIFKLLNIEVASVAEARAMLKLPKAA
jgi:hypothetical protein